MRLPERHAERAFMVVMTFFMSMCMSAIVTALNLGADGFPDRWLRAWGVAFCIALPLVMILSPMSRWLVAQVTERDQEGDNECRC